MPSESSRLPLAVAAIERGIADGLHPGAQLYVSVNGECVADLAVGDARTGVPMRPETILLWLSAGKPITAAGVAQLSEQQRLSLDAPVKDFIPEFAIGNKDAITTRHLLTHTCGIRTGDKCDAGTEWAEIIECVCHTPAEPHSVPGKTAAYHPSASWYILGEIIRRMDGRSPEQCLREEILAPCGMVDTWLALPPAHFQRYEDRIGWMFHTEEHSAAPHRRWNSEADAAVCRPGRSCRGPIRELGRFYETLLQLRLPSAATAVAILRPETVQAMTTRQRQGMFDDTFQQIIDWGLGFAIDSKRYGRERVSYGFGRFASDEAFGHGGAQSSCAFADPKHGLVVAWVFNGMPGERKHQLRAHELNSAIYQDLGLGK